MLLAYWITKPYSTVRTDRWRYTEWDRGEQGSELYDHYNDPDECYNLASDSEHAQTIETLREVLQEI
jgi:iduronate 2-sulfatase